MSYQIKFYNSIDVTESKFNSKIKNISDQFIDDINSKTGYESIFDISNILNSSEYNECVRTADKIKNKFKNLIIIGMGGAYYCSSVVLRFAKKDRLEDDQTPNLFFLNNTNISFINETLSDIDLKETALLIISNSGNSLETLSLTSMCFNLFEENDIAITGRVFVITNIKKDIKNNKLHKLALEIDADIIAHKEGINGRYAIFSSVSFFVMLIKNMDIESYIDGALNVINHYISNSQVQNNQILSSVIFLLANSCEGLFWERNIFCNISYLDKMDLMMDWYGQIISESIGKDGKGFLVKNAIAPHDQHSSLQLYLDGPNDKIYTIFYCEKELDDRNLSSKYIALSDIKNHTMNNIHKIGYLSTKKEMINRGLRLREFILSNDSIYTIGGLAAHFMLEVILLAKMVDVNPFDQRAVEGLKINARKLL